ncbi:16S rRNA (cytosine(967)-C(5))-methyltransferase RsmB [Larsenimonas salina]|uniref:16S rRNA (cytosine(967)-C(5))-methyltransferase RsmB n=1 Tax=Larsenimonas salina TaxID=1295565 RepID=UPI0020741DE2|nr:16S rRNA (cytosine(967)-C(5))-methyltransferase RsmB [Larsenimonas salina]MCM5704344.1 16S rRNA (cytosine(967)-C(5))-methyltransferase RsmB [Larsenimonas salina]
MSQARALAATTLARVLTHQGSLSTMTPENLPPRDHGFYKALCFGVCRELPRLNALAEELLRQPFKRKDQDIQALLLLGLYQLYHMRVPAHAAVGETAGAAKTLKKPWATRVLNGCLRRAERERVELQAKVDALPEAALRHPRWMIDAIKHAWPEQWSSILAGNNTPGPMTLRVNGRRQSREAYLARLEAAGMSATAVAGTEMGLTLETPCDVEQLPGFVEGDVSVQDTAAQLAAPLLAPYLADNARVLDACSAPGGKAAHLLERVSTLELTALDSDSTRLGRVDATLSRLGLDATLRHGDGTGTDWWDGTPFQAILCDAPCSGTGVIRRHPDIKWLRTPEDLDTLAATQAALLDSLWTLLAPGGVLLYATCSVIPKENQAQIEKFLSRTPEAVSLPLPLELGLATDNGRQLLPTEHGHDGFFYALISKPAA